MGMDRVYAMASLIHAFTDKDSDDDERIMIGSSIIKRRDSGLPEFGVNGRPPQEIEDVIFSDRSPYYEVNGSNERWNTAMQGKIPKYNEDQFKKDMAIAKGLLSGVIEPDDVMFVYRPSEESNLKKSGGHDFKQTHVTKETKRYRGHTYKPDVLEKKQSVLKYQKRLADLGYYQGEIDGIAGPKTRQAVQEFQTKSGLAADGVVGKKTTAALFGE